MNKLKKLGLALAGILFSLNLSAQVEDENDYLVNDKEGENMQRIEIMEADLPQSISDAMHSAYPKGIWIEGFRVIDEEGEVQRYIVRLERDGERDVVLQYDAEGNQKGDTRKKNSQKMKPNRE